MPEDTADDAGSTEDTGNTGGEVNDGDTGDGQPEEEAKTFTQADVDKIISQRVAREATRYADFDKYKSAYAEQERTRLASATELEQAVAAARAETTAEITGKTNLRLVSSEARAIAAAANFHNPADVVGLVDLSQVQVDEDGEVDSDAVKDLIKDLIKDSPYLVKTAEEAKPTKPKPDHSQGPRGNGSGSTADQFAAALGPLFS